MGLLGGSFDPIHYGHLRAAEWAKEAFGLHEVRLMPARQSPFKGPARASDGDRVAMLNLATADNPVIGVETCELLREAPSYTIDTLRALQDRSPDAHFTLVLGSDAAADVELWREIAQIRRLAEIRVLGRPGDRVTPGQITETFEGLAISSTEIRTLIKGGHSIRYLTPEAVRQYIEEKGLYK